MTNVIALALVSLFTDMSSEMIYPLLPLFLATTLGSGASVVGIIEGSAQTVASLLGLVSGRWSDRVARRKPLVVAGYGLASLLRPLIGLAQSAVGVFAIRIGDRIGKGIRSAPRDALLADSVDASARGRAFGLHRAADHAGAVIGPLIAFALLQWGGRSTRQVFLLSAIPAAMAMLVLLVMVRDVPRRLHTSATEASTGALPGSLTRYLAALGLFTLGNSTDAFLLLRASDAGIPTAQLPLLWALLHVVKSASALPGGALSDRIGRRPLIVAGWAVYAVVYLAFGQATSAWHIWGLMTVYGLHHGLTEGAEKAFVADLVPAGRRGQAFGRFHLTVGLMALPASVLFGWIWQRWSASAAFTVGAACAVAACGILLTVTRSEDVPTT